MSDKSPDPGRITRLLKEEALRLGFSQVGVCPAVSPLGYDHFKEWLDRGFAGEMDYLGDRREAYQDPSSILSGARSVLMLTLDYRTEDPQSPQPGQGRISRYAWGEADYHDLIHQRLKALRRYANEVVPGCRARGVVDTAPLLERDFARLAGLGWQGKNTLLLSRTGGSLFFLAALVLDLRLDYDSPFESDHCGTCSACLEACPTSAFPQPHLLDARRCISYLTIELRSPIPRELRPQIGDWLFGCDVCQDVCPWQSKSRPAREPRFAPRDDSDPADLLELFGLDETQFRERFRKTPLWRTRREGLLRNAAIVLGNQRFAPAVPILTQALLQEAFLVRGACAWALGQIGDPAAIDALRKAHGREQDETVLEEIALALAEQETPKPQSSDENGA